VRDTDAGPCRLSTDGEVNHMGIKKMRIVITKDGHTEVRVEGGQGDDCLAFTRALEQAVGRVEQRELTADYHDYDPLTVRTREEAEEQQAL